MQDKATTTNSHGSVENEDKSLPRVFVRQLQERDNEVVRQIWSEAMLSHGLQQAREFVEKRYDDPTDMGNAFASFLGERKNFWVAVSLEEYLQDTAGTTTGTTSAAKIDPGGRDLAHEGEKVIGCVGGLFRDTDDLRRFCPHGKEYLKRDPGDEVPLWQEPLGIPDSARSSTSRGAVELVRMAVAPEYRGRMVVEVGQSLASRENEREHDTQPVRVTKVAQLLAEQVARYAQADLQSEFVVLSTASAMKQAVRAYEKLGFQGRLLVENVAFSARCEDLLRQANQNREAFLEVG
ncbi:unnamed protein product [Amoebophrya sp. A120]|nr:unnamed protein product [Amoebophrya sp. A120]|eukprot:GSA120T00021254001.1